MKIYSETDTSFYIEVVNDKIISFNDAQSDKSIPLNIQIDMDYIDDDYNWGYNPNIINLWTDQQFDYIKDTLYYEVEVHYKGKVAEFDYYISDISMTEDEENQIGLSFLLK